MDEQAPNYRGEFWKSPHHIALGLLTLGLGFMCGQILPLIVGATCYALGCLHVPDMSFFRRWVDRRVDATRQAAALAQVNDFVRRRDALLGTLTDSRREKYANLAEVCRDIETAGAENAMMAGDASADPRLRKLDELMWTYLRLLGIEESLDRFLETERQEDVPRLVAEGDAEVKRLAADLDALKAKGPSATYETKQRYLGSRMERLEVLRKRENRITEAQENLALVISEQERLTQQIKLIRADAVAMKNAESLTARIDATVEHLDQTNKWISEMDEFKDLVGDMPATDMRIGYRPVVPPVIDTARQIRRPAQRYQRN